MSTLKSLIPDPNHIYLVGEIEVKPLLTLQELNFSCVPQSCKARAFVGSSSCFFVHWSSNNARFFLCHVGPSCLDWSAGPILQISDTASCRHLCKGQPCCVPILHLCFLSGTTPNNGDQERKPGAAIYFPFSCLRETPFSTPTHHPNWIDRSTTTGFTPRQPALEGCSYPHAPPERIVCFTAPTVTGAQPHELECIAR